MRRRRSHVIGILLFLAAAVAAAAPHAHATTVRRLSEVELVSASSWILEGRVLSAQGAWTADRTRIFTTVEIAVTGVLKGELAEKTLRLRVLGGSADGMSMVVVGAPVFRPGEEVVLCLGSNRTAALPIVGLDQGKFTLVTEPGTRVRRVAGTGETREAFLTRLRGMIQR